MKKLLLLLCCLICCLQTIAQPRNNLRVAWEYAWDLQRIERDEIININYNSNGLYLNSESFFSIIGNSNLTYPLFLKILPNGEIADTVILKDTAYKSNKVLLANNNSIWHIGQRILQTPINQSYNLTKADLQGRILIRNKIFINPNNALFTDSFPQNNFLTLPLANEEFILVGNRGYRFNNQNVTSINISRWDSLGNRIWVKDFLLRFQFSSPNAIVFDSDGQLLISAISNTEATALKVDTASGRLIWKRVMARSNTNAPCYNFKIYPTPLGYYFHADCPDSSTPNLYSIHSSIPADSSQTPFFSARYFGSIRAVFPMADSSMHIMYFDGYRFLIDKIRYDSTLLNRLPITGIQGMRSNGYGDPNSFCKVLNSAAYFSDGSAILGGYSSVENCGNTAIYYCKIENFGLPFAPIYPPTPVIPAPVSAAKKSPQEKWFVYPNPNNGTFRSSLSGNLKIYNNTGQLIFEGFVHKEEEVRVKQISSGIYIAEIEHLNKMHRLKLVVQN